MDGNEATARRDHKDRLFCRLFGDIIYMGMHNDVTCIIDCSMALFEKYLVQNGLNIYQRAQIKIPAPQFYVLYNGRTDHMERVCA